MSYQSDVHWPVFHRGRGPKSEGHGRLRRVVLVTVCRRTVANRRNLGGLSEVVAASAPRAAQMPYQHPEPGPT